MNPHVTLFPADSTLEVGVLNLGWGEGMFSGANGGRYRWVRRSFWRGEWAFTDEKDETLVSFTPQPGFTGDPTSISYTVQDSGGRTSNPATITIDYVPVAVNDSATTSGTTPVTINVLANDHDVDSTSLSLVSVGQGAHGSVSANANNSVTYRAVPGFVGVDTFSYTVSDSLGARASAVVTVTVRGRAGR
jgi:hypothetical protein